MLPEQERSEFLTSLSPQELKELESAWWFWGRPKQFAPPGDWRIWLILAGRGFGKTRTGAEWIRARAESGRYPHLALIGKSVADVRDVMIKGESGILAVSPKSFRPKYKPSLRVVEWPNGVTASTYSAEEPDQLRGPQHDAGWADELAKWKYPEETWDNFEMGLRTGPQPQAVVTTTPRPIKIVKELVADPQTVITHGTSYENERNLAPSFIHRVISKYQGTRLGRQELEAQILDDNPAALWTRARIELLRVRRFPQLTRIVVGVDPEATSGEESAETGIVVAGLGIDGHGYVLDDVSLRATPHGWGSAAVTAYYKWQADRIIAETNNGGEMVEFTVRTIDANVSYKAVHASRGKQTRAEPVSALYEQGKVHHVGAFAELEDQQCQWQPGEKSPDRLDALVWCLTELMITGSHGEIPLAVTTTTEQTPLQARMLALHEQTETPAETPDEQKAQVEAERELRQLELRQRILGGLGMKF